MFVAEYSAGDFNHCSTVCRYQDGVTIAWYAGTGECRNDQAVNVAFFGQRLWRPIRVGDNTGNPVLWRHGEHCVLLYSLFEDSGALRSLVDRWKYCSLWLQKLFVDQSASELRLVGDPILLAGSERSLLGRCAPIWCGGQMLLPLYNESDRYGEIWAGDGWQFEPFGKLGEPGCGAIQPALLPSCGGTLDAICRNISPGGAFVYEFASEDGGKTWGRPKLGRIYNRNNSLQILADKNRMLVLWNNSRLGRDQLTLGRLDLDTSSSRWTAKQMAMLGEPESRHYGSYPAMCYDRRGDLHITYTTVRATVSHCVIPGRHVSKLYARTRVGQLL